MHVVVTGIVKNAGCVIEEDIEYLGNDVSSMNQTDVASCRSSCSSIGTGYFTYSIDESRCYCKHSDAGRKQTGGHVSGDTSCTGGFQSFWSTTATFMEYYPCNHDSIRYHDAGDTMISRTVMIEGLLILVDFKMRT